MTTEDDFQRTLDANPTDWQTRLVFADWLQDRADPRADGYRALGSQRHQPACWAGTIWGWLNAQLYPGYKNMLTSDTVLPDDWYNVLPRGKYHAAEYRTRRAAEDAAALAFPKLPAPRRAELLAASAQ